MDSIVVFNPEGGLSGEAIEACHANNIDPIELIPRGVEYFKRNKVSLEGAQTLHAANRKKRAGLLNLVRKHIQQARI